MGMQREWNPRSFFRRLTPEAVSVFTQSAGIDIGPSTSTDAGPPGARLYEAWKAMAEGQRRRLEAELFPVNDMCVPQARPYLEGAARATWTDGKAALLQQARDWSAQDLALRLYLDAPRAFFDAYKSYAVDTMEHLREYRGATSVSLTLSDSKRARLEAELQRHFRDTAFGARCQVEDHASEDKLALFVYHEDEVTPLERFNEAGAMTTDWQRPVLRIAAVFHTPTATLQVKASRTAEREKLRDLFAEVYVGDAAFFEDTSKAPKFNFDVLRYGDFHFPTRPMDGIDSVSLVKVVARPADDDVRRVVVDLQPGLSLARARLVLEDHGIDVAHDVIDGVHLRFTFAGSGRSRFRTISLANPNSTNLHDTPRDRVIRHYLSQWGIDATVRAAAVAAPALEAAAG